MEGDFTIAEFQVKGNWISYIAKVTGEQENSTEVCSVRPYGKIPNNFALHEIKTILAKSEYSDNTNIWCMYHFDIDFSKSNSH